MAAPTPIHRDPDVDGDDYGCVGLNARKANAAIAYLVADMRIRLRARKFGNTDELVNFVRSRLKQFSDLYRCGSCDTIVKENVFAALHEAIEKSGLEGVDQMELCGW